MSDPEGVSPIFHLLPSAWLETAGVTAEQFDHCYFQRTGRHRAVQRLEDAGGKDLTDRIVGHMGRLDEQQAEQFVQDFKEHMVTSRREGLERAHGPASAEQATGTMYYYADAANQTKGPLSLQGLLDLRSKAVIADTTYVIEAGTQDWKPFSSVLPPPVPPASSPPPSASSIPAQDCLRNVCPQCHGEYEFSRQHLGRESNCPHCNAPVTLQPGPSTLPDNTGVELCLSRAQSGDAAAQCELGFYYYTGQSVLDSETFMQRCPDQGRHNSRSGPG